MQKHSLRSWSAAALLACAGVGLHAAGTPSIEALDAAASSGTVVSPDTSTTSTPLAANDRSFVIKAAGGGLYEVEVSQLAGQKASDPAVKSYAAMLVKQHAQANEELKQLAASKGMALPAKPPREKQAAIDRLAKMKGTAFDRQYVRMVGISDHQADIKLFEKASQNARDAELKAWIDKTLPTLREHLQAARNLPGAQ